MGSWRETVAERFPGVLSFAELAEGAERCAAAAGVENGALRWARLACREDRLGAEERPLNRRWGLPCRLASLGAFPTVGFSGLRELARSVPPAGAMLLISGPHAAITARGAWGFALPGGCVALEQSYARLAGPRRLRPLDLEADALEGALRSMPPPRFSGPNVPLELTIHAARVIDQVLGRILDRRPLPRLIWVSGLVIKTPAGALFAPLRLRLRGLPLEAARAWEAREAARPREPDS